MTKLRLSLVALCALFALGCSPEDAGPYDDGDAALVVEAGTVGDAGEGGPAIPQRDAAVEAAAAVMDADTGPRQDGGDAAVTVSDASAVDAAVARDASLVDAGEARDASAPDSATQSVKPSPGCGKAGRPNGGRISVAGDHNYTFPADYDGKQPFPLLIGFHAASNPIDQIETLTKGTELEQRYVRAFPKSKGSAWDYNADIAKVLAMYDDLVANHCVDTSRVFATGHSSGAQLIVQILTPAHKGDADRLRFKAVAPVAASRYGSVSRAIPVLYIQGQHDNVRNSDGADVVREFTTANGCMAASTPYPGVAMCTSSGKSVKSGCIQYAGCNVPTLWCSHDDPQYGNTNHGWPCFASKAMADFFGSLP